jgi:hypothetical protein
MKLNVRENASSVSPPILSPESTELIKQPGISSLSSQFLIQEIKELASAKSGELGGWENTDIPRFIKNMGTTPEECAVYYRTEDTRTHFHETQA